MTATGASGPQKSNVQVKGAALKAIVTYITERFGTATHEAAVARLDLEERRAIEAAILVSSWYDIEMFEHYLTAVAALQHIDAVTLSSEAGRFSAEFGVRGVYKVMMRLGSPEFIIGRGASFWRSYYNRGEMRAEKTGERESTLELRDLGYQSELLCPRLGAWIARIAELAGGKDIEIKHIRCVRRGDDVCSWRAHWS